MASRTYKIEKVTDVGDGFLVTIFLTPDSSWIEEWTYEAMAKYLNELASEGKLEVDELYAMKGY